MGPVIYSRVAKNKIIFRNVNTGIEDTVFPTNPFTTVRMLVGEFLPFQVCFKEGLLKVQKKSFLSFGPSVVIHAMEMNEGGLCEIERRILQEGAIASGARRVIIHEGLLLSDQAVIALVK